ncbi:acyltransferase family protein [Sphingobium sp. CAP-1]|uniref:acyltransferase family protein n=1 Tax=Sphingobium sp. CAP-1 TaxID=2676077 RepID=UPI001E46E592|nr:acyltransferase family protein [Sphingobium sp. CAP-1]
MTALGRRALDNGLLFRSSSTSSAEVQEVARGYLLLCVFYIHAMIGVAMHVGDNAWYSLIQLKLLAPNVSAFFFLSGMAAPALHRKGPAQVLHLSLVLILLAGISHTIGFLIILAGVGFPTPWDAAREFLKPLLLGTGYSSFVAWFFVVLAVARLFAYMFLRSKPLFIVLIATVTAAIWIGKQFGLPDNIYEWRNWPTATLFFLIGMKLPDAKKIPWWVAIAAILGSILLTLINRHGLLRIGPCLTCDLHFVSQPMVGQYGSIFAYVPQQLLFIIFLLWAAERSAPMLIGRVARFFGQASLPILLLHGWVLLILYPRIFDGISKVETPFLFIAIFSYGLVVHALLYVWLVRPLHWIQMLIFRVSHLSIRRGRRDIAGPSSGETVSASPLA